MCPGRQVWELPTRRYLPWMRMPTKTRLFITTPWNERRKLHSRFPAGSAARADPRLSGWSPQAQEGSPIEGAWMTLNQWLSLRGMDWATSTQQERKHDYEITAHSVYLCIPWLARLLQLYWPIGLIVPSGDRYIVWLWTPPSWASSPISTPVYVLFFVFPANAFKYRILWVE